MAESALTGEDASETSPLISYFEWWDCPRGGVALLLGRPHYFTSAFSEALDDYEDSYSLWPVPRTAITAEAEWWALWCAWRASFDRGESPSPIESDARFEELTNILRDLRQRPVSASRLRAEWILDRDHSFARKAPEHQVRWQSVS